MCYYRNQLFVEIEQTKGCTTFAVAISMSCGTVIISGCYKRSLVKVVVVMAVALLMSKVESKSRARLRGLPLLAT
jgi:hypothetical protein